MIPTKVLKLSAFLFVLCSMMLSCAPEKKEPIDKEINVWLKRDPAKLNPIIYPSSASREVYQYILLSMAEFDPVTLTLRPILIKSLPEAQKIIGGDYDGGISYEFEILEEAEWGDGTPVTAQDYLFTIKAVKNPLVQSGAWRPFFKDVQAINIDPENNRKFEVIFGKPYMLALEALVTAYIYPAHIYDAHNAMSKVTLTDLASSDVKDLMEADSAIVTFAKEMNSAKFSRDIVTGAGPYKLSRWETDQFLVLEKKENYWGDKFKDNPFLQGYAEKLNFKIIKDENAAIGLLKTGDLDVVGGLSSKVFSDLKNSEQARFSFFNPQLIRYYYLMLNNEDPILKQRSVRRAIAHVTDVPQIINNLEDGMGTRQVGHFHSTKSYYNKDLSLIQYDLQKAKDVLESDGWIDSDNDGIRDKVIDGKNTPLVLEVLISKKELGRRVAMMVQESAQRVGIKINLETQSQSIINERLKKGQYNVTASALLQDPSPDDPYSKWHSQSKSNYARYSNAKVDSLIGDLRHTVRAEDRAPLYKEIQEIIYEDQPVVFLYSPKERIILSKKLNGKATAKRPGYLANTFSFKE